MIATPYLFGWTHVPLRIPLQDPLRIHCSTTLCLLPLFARLPRGDADVPLSHPALPLTLHCSPLFLIIPHACPAASSYI